MLQSKFNFRRLVILSTVLFTLCIVPANAASIFHFKNMPEAANRQERIRLMKGIQTLTREQHQYFSVENQELMQKAILESEDTVYCVFPTCCYSYDDMLTVIKQEYDIRIRAAKYYFTFIVNDTNTGNRYMVWFIVPSDYNY